MEFTRRDLAGLAASALVAKPSALLAQAAPSPGPTLDIAEWSYFWVGTEHISLPRGTIANGMQMYVEYQIPARVAHPYPIVLIHGGASQGTDWISTPDGRRGWASHLVELGYAVYIVDRPGQGRPPYHPFLHGYFESQAWTRERAAREFTSLSGQTQWPGGDAALDQLVAPLGPAMPNNAQTHQVWRSRGAMLLDQIGSAILVTRGDSGAFAWTVADERPNLVKGIVAIEPSGPPFAGLPWGIAASRLTYDPAPASPAELRANPSRRLKNLAGIPIAVVTAEASGAAPRDAATVTFLQQAGCTVEHLRLAEHGVRGNGPLLMMEKNNREALQPVTQWIESAVTKPVPVPPADTNRNSISTAVKLADQGCFWVGVQHKTMPYGTIPLGQMYVQYAIPAEKRYPYPVVMVHGGGGQGTHMMGIGQRPGWVHYFLQAGYSVYWVDRPAHGRPPYHPDALGPSHLRNFTGYEPIVASNSVFATGQWPGTGAMDDPLVDQFMANEIDRLTDETLHSELCARGGAELLDKIGPSILVTQGFGGFFGWVVADLRPNLVKGIMCMEINGNPFAGAFRWGLAATKLTYDPPVSDPSEFRLVDRTAPPDSPRPVVSPYKVQAEPARKLKNLAGFPIGWITSEFGGGGSGVAQVAFLNQAGCSAELIRLRDFGLSGNGNLMMLEKNNHEVFAIIRDWLIRKVAPPRA